MARSHPPSFDFYPDDFIGGTLGMHPCARGIYITLLCHQWSHGPLSLTNSRQLVQITGAMPDELTEHLPEVILKFEQLENGDYLNQRLEREYARKIEIREKRVSAGASGGRPKASAKQKDKHLLSKRKAKLEVGSRKKEVNKKEIECVDPSTLDLPFKSPEFGDAWLDFLAMRLEKGCPVKATGAKASLKRLAEMGEARAVAALVYTTANEWQGIREPDQPARQSSSGPKTFRELQEANTERAKREFVNG